VLAALLELLAAALGPAEAAEPAALLELLDELLEHALISAASASPTPALIAAARRRL
jgi:hypothetical protein